MTEWRPLFDRLRREHSGDVLHEGVPGWLKPSLIAWVQERLEVDSYGGPSRTVLELIQRECRIESLDWTNGAYSAADSLILRMVGDEELALEVLNLLLFWSSKTSGGIDAARDLNFILVTAGSAWTVAGGDGALWRLERRVPSEVAERFAEVSAKGRAGQHLRLAWSEVYGREPDPSTAYREAVRAVEAAGASVISPGNERATLGTMIADFRAKPQKWIVPLGKTPNQGREALLSMMEGVWHGQSDRHGSPDEGKPLSVTAFEAEAALHTTITLVHLFVSGLVARP